MAPRKQQEIFDATLRLVAEKGYDGLTVEGVAERAGVNKTTIYRWWPSKAALLGAALVESDVLAFDAPDTGSLRGDLVALVEGVRRLLTEPPGSDIAVAALGAAVRHPELDARRFFADRFARERRIFERAVGRGELKESADPMLIVDLLAGAVWMRAVFRGLRPGDDFATEAVSALLDGI
ncbi:transcriptional regulator, TetR family [[Actinomadura] parvosata subsp. kistnae]|uniref:TetR family transcriptional regulator n=1 Tax=[Actinomadura] parvosata subsp. kistnae TaxID=1909395 RepID=A0A1V0A8A9_9ACTN|nr:TetR/AcrR family transcriptional regulator [Nonomuraea sp. ATCC 55076]AQZ66456.1 TetR family transcriptional regulator [Nonomuraea sp. ATCC 55076]SPL95482.1 transcriptional regulator, TetR family [Actinomadura parvosata subsp. kistnae]